jgi:hypothetical protein
VNQISRVEEVDLQ